MFKFKIRVHKRSVVGKFTSERQKLPRLGTVTREYAFANLGILKSKFRKLKARTNVQSNAKRRRGSVWDL